MVENSQNLDPSNAKDQAAIKLQKVYKGFRIRRNLADCAVLVEQSWWKLLNFADLREKTRAAQVGKGLPKEYWLEAIDPRHRYGLNLHFYYVKWFNSESRQPFFYWLDIGEGKEVNVEMCPRLQLQRQCIKYLGPMERMCYEVVVDDGKLFYKQSGELVHTTSDSVWIFVLSTSNTFYVGKKKKGMFQHSSFLAGGAATSAGKLIVERGILKEVWPQSGHYRPTVRDFKGFLSFLQQNNVDQRLLCFRKSFRLLWDMATRGCRFLTREYKILKLGQNAISFCTACIRAQGCGQLHEIAHGRATSCTVKERKNGENNKMTIEKRSTNPGDDEDGSLYKRRSSRHLRNHSSEEDITETVNGLEIEETNKENVAVKEQKSGIIDSFSKKSTDFDELKSAVEKIESKELFIDDEDNKVENIPKKAILQRINSKKGTKSYQLGRQLCCKWTTGAGPRIGCVRDYPWQLQFRALEQVNLSPRRITHSKSIGALSRKMSI